LLSQCKSVHFPNYPLFRLYCPYVQLISYVFICCNNITFVKGMICFVYEN
jgi:hypothetical protein